MSNQENLPYDPTADSNLYGDRLYQQRARAALPILVRQARAGQTIFYSELARELDMPNARNLNYPLGTVGNALVELSQQWGEEIPPIQCVVVNKQNGLPGEGFNWFIKDRSLYEKATLQRKQELVDKMLTGVFNYGRWDAVLAALGLPPAPAPDDLIAEEAALPGNHSPVPESPAHERLKAYVAAHPEIVWAPRRSSATVEYVFPTGDVLDVLFQHRTGWVGVEVKSHISDTADIRRGLFQCVKYQALMKAVLQAAGERPEAYVVLVLEGQLPAALLPLKNVLKIDVIEGIVPA